MSIITFLQSISLFDNCHLHIYQSVISNNCFAYISIRKENEEVLLEWISLFNDFEVSLFIFAIVCRNHLETNYCILKKWKLFDVGSFHLTHFLPYLESKRIISIFQMILHLLVRNKSITNF